MKPFLCLVCAIAHVFSAFGQVPDLGLCTQKTCSLIFPLPVRHVDRGSVAVLVQPVPGAENILLVKAAEEDFRETNLSVVTEDGSLYTFTVCYNPDPAVLSFHVPLLSKASLAADARMILDNPPLFRGPGKQLWGVHLLLSGVYVRDRTVLLQFTMRNQSALVYDVAYLRFALKDQKQSRRTAMQEADLQPLLITGNHTSIAAGSQTCFVVALPLITIPAHQYLSVEIGEQGGGRNFGLRLSNRQLLRAKPLPDLQ